MAIPFDDILKKLPAEEQAAIETRSRELVAEYLTLQDLRKAQALPQEREEKKGRVEERRSRS